MSVFILIACLYKGGCFTIEFNSKVECEQSAKAFSKRNTMSSDIVYCQEKRK